MHTGVPRGRLNCPNCPCLQVKHFPSLCEVLANLSQPLMHVYEPEHSLLCASPFVRSGGFCYCFTGSLPGPWWFLRCQSWRIGFLEMEKFEDFCSERSLFGEFLPYEAQMARSKLETGAVEAQHASIGFSRGPKIHYHPLSYVDVVNESSFHWSSVT